MYAYGFKKIIISTNSNSALIYSNVLDFGGS